MEEAASAQEEINWKGGEGDGGGRVEGTGVFGGTGLGGAWRHVAEQSHHRKKNKINKNMYDGSDTGMSVWMHDATSVTLPVEKNVGIC